jgi:flagellar basal-body rod protein FlgF
MSNAIYATLARQQGLMQEMQVVSNNLANSSTTG